MAAGIDANKAKAARRVVEVLEYFDEQNRQATVMDIARRYKRPQSSTSELLAMLVDMGLLYKDPNSRCFSPTPRAAMLGSVFQPRLVRDGRLAMLSERLSAQTGLGAAVVGMVGLDAQVFRFAPGADGAAAKACVGGAQTPLHTSAAGWLLLSTLAPERREGVLHRLRAEAPVEAKFNLAELSHQVRACAQDGFAMGPAGFGASSRMCAVLLPAEPGERPMALGLVSRADHAEAANLVALLRDAVSHCMSETSPVVDLGEYRVRAEAASGSDEAQLRRA